tara:strand:- start:193 stop:333 length:141 start_codon:yes stop_codon:yes gene_type:complete
VDKNFKKLVKPSILTVFKIIINVNKILIDVYKKKIVNIKIKRSEFL